MENLKTIKVELGQKVATVTLNRPKVHNAFNDEMIVELSEAFGQLDQDTEVRAVLLKGAGKSFSAGADLNWMKKAASYSREENISDAKRFHNLLEAIESCSKPVIALAQGVVLGGGCGLVAAADLAYAYEDVQFGFSEVRLGLVPAVIAPFVIRKIGAGFAREFFLTGERFGARVAYTIGLIHGCGGSKEIDAVIEGRVQQILKGAPGAIASAKKLIREVINTSWEAVGDCTAQRIAERRASEEGKEGMTAFLEKRKASWDN